MNKHVEDARARVGERSRIQPISLFECARMQGGCEERKRFV